MKIKGGRRPVKSGIGNFINIFLLAFLGIFMVLPLVYITVTAFKPMDELFMFPPRFFVNNPTLNNFRSLSSVLSSSLVPISRYVFNTVFITIVATLGQMIVVSLAAFILEKRNFPGKNFLFSIVVTSLMFSPQVTAIPNYIIMSKINWLDTYQSLIVPAVASSLGLFLMKQFMCNIPDVLLEAARIDGAGEFRIFYQIVLPLVKPAWLTLIIFAFQSMWGITGGNYIFTETYKPLNYALNQIVNSGIARAGAAAAVQLLMLIPPIAVFIISQSSILETMASSGIKE